VRCGYRRIHVLLRREEGQINHKRVRSLYRQEGLNLRLKRPRRHVMAARRCERPLTSAANQVWAMDFVSNALFNGRRFRALLWLMPIRARPWRSWSNSICVAMMWSVQWSGWSSIAAGRQSAFGWTTVPNLSRECSITGHSSTA
jgi:hypothetical protein